MMAMAMVLRGSGISQCFVRPSETTLAISTRHECKCLPNFENHIFGILRCQREKSILGSQMCAMNAEWWRHISQLYFWYVV